MRTEIVADKAGKDIVQIAFFGELEYAAKRGMMSSPLRKVLFRSKAITARYMEFSPVLQPRRKEHFSPADS